MRKFASSGYFLVVMSSIALSFKSILIKMAYQFGLDATTLMLMRMYISLPFFAATLIVLEGRQGFKITGREAIKYSFMGIVGIGCAMLFSFLSLELVEASLATLVVFTYPAMTILMLYLFFGEKITLSKFAAMIITFVGLVLVIGLDQVDILAVKGKGIIFALLSAFCFALYNSLSERALKHASPVKLTTSTAIFLVGFFGFFFGNRHYPDSYETWAIASLLGVVTGFIPFLAYMYGIKKIGAGKAVIISSLGPVFTVIWAYIFLGERLNSMQITGMALILSGVVTLKLKLRSPLSLIRGTGEEIKERLENIATEYAPDRKLFAFVYTPGAVKNKKLGEKQDGGINSNTH